MSGPDLCPKCNGLHFKTAPCVVRKALSSEKYDPHSDYDSILWKPTEKRPVGRPKTITDMKAYKAAKAREYRARKANGTGH